MVWRDATIPVMAALLARWWFTNCPVWYGHAVASIIVLCSPGGIVATVRKQVAALGLSVAFVGHDAYGLDPGLRGRGPW